MATAVRQRGLFIAEDWKVVYRSFTEINFSAYDFNTIRNAMIDYIRINFPEDFNDWIESSEFVAIIELLAYLGQSLAFRGDLNTRENFLDTAERRESVLKLARMLSYNSNRNIAAVGLVKLDQISTSQPLTDSNGTNLANRTVRWNDANNPDWYEQFILILNSLFVSTNPFGKPAKDGIVNSIKTQLYTLDNDPVANKTFSFNSLVNNESLGFEIVNPDFTDGEVFFEKEPDPEEPLSIIFRNDGEGNASTNTGFFLMFKQGTLVNEDFRIDVPIENRVIEVSGTNINNTDVFVHEIDDSGFVINKWKKVPSVVGDNVIFNSISNSERDIFSVITQPDDKVNIRFADGRFGNVPTGLIRVWYRKSANKRYTIKPENMRNNRLDIPYYSGVGNDVYFANLTFSLKETVANSSPSQLSSEIKQTASQGYYTQDRMVNGEDYNVYPLQNSEAARIKSVNRSYSGFNRHIDINDPTGQSQNVNMFGEDGLLYLDINNSLTELPLTAGVSDLSVSDIVDLHIAPLLVETERRHFVYYHYPRFTPTESVITSIAGVTGTTYTAGEGVFDTGITQQIRIRNGVETDVTVTLVAAGTGTPGTTPATLGNTSTVGDFVTEVVAALPGGTTVTVADGSIADDQLEITDTAGNSLIINQLQGDVLTLLGIVPKTYAPRTYGTYWRKATNAVNSSTGRFFTDTDTIGNVAEAPIKIGAAASTISSEFHMNEGAMIKFKTAGWVSIVSIVDDGDTILTTGDGAVRLSEDVNEEDYVETIIMPYRSLFTDQEILSIKSYISQNNTFGIRYDIATETWKIITGDNLAPEATAFSFANAGSSIGTPIDSSWILRAEFSQTNWRFIVRGLDYIFESDADLRFFFATDKKIVSAVTGNTVIDFVKVLNINPEYSVTYNSVLLGTAAATYVNNESIIINGTTVTLSTGTTVADAKTDIDTAAITGLTTAVVSTALQLTYSGATPLVLASPTGETALTDLGFTAGKSADTVDFNESNTLGLAESYQWNVENVFTESDGYIDTRRVKVTFTDADEDGVPDDPTFFETITLITSNDDDGAEPVDNTLDVSLVDSTIDSTELFWEAFTNSDGFQEFKPSIAVVNALNTDPGDLTTPTPPTSSNIPSVFDATLSQGDVIYFRDTEDFYRVKVGTGLDEFELVTGLYYRRRGRDGLFFHWKHYAPIENRIDPAITNVIDIYVLTITYDTEIRQWIDDGGSVDSKPTPLTTEGLKNLFINESQNKMISDEIVWHPVSYKLLFGSQASTDLQATFKVTKVSGTETSDGEIRAGVIGAINEFFAINNFDFGETFYFTELSAFIHQKLATKISSIVIVPLDAEQNFGDLFQVRSLPNEVFISSAKVSDVQIVSTFNDNILRIGR